MTKLEREVSREKQGHQRAAVTVTYGRWHCFDQWTESEASVLVGLVGGISLKVTIFRCKPVVISCQPQELCPFFILFQFILFYGYGSWASHNHSSLVSSGKLLPMTHITDLHPSN